MLTLVLVLKKYFHKLKTGRGEEKNSRMKETHMLNHIKKMFKKVMVEQWKKMRELTSDSIIIKYWTTIAWNRLRENQLSVTNF